MEFEKSGEELKISIMAEDEQAALRLLAAAGKKYGIDITNIPKVIGTEMNSYPERIHRELKIGEECYRSVAKMALTYAATCISDGRLRGGDFSDVIGFIKGEIETNNFSRFESAQLFASHPKNDEINHRIFFYSSKERTRAAALIELFGHFRFSVTLTDRWTGNSMGLAHVVNPVTHERETIDIPISHSIFDELGRMPKTIRDIELEGAIASIRIIISRRHRANYLSKLVKKSFNFTEGDPDRNISVEEFEKTMNDLKAQLSRFIMREESQSTIDLSKFMEDDKESGK